LLNSRGTISGWLCQSRFHVQTSAADFDFWAENVAPNVLSANLGPPPAVDFNWWAPAQMASAVCERELDQLRESYREFSRTMWLNNLGWNSHVAVALCRIMWLSHYDAGATLRLTKLAIGARKATRLERAARRQALLQDLGQSTRPNRYCFWKGGCPRQKCARKR
jgi:hypothetical protein